MSKDWTHRLPEILEDYTEAAPEGLWDAVQAGAVASRKRRGAVLWWSGAALVAAAAALLLIFLPRQAPLQPEVLPVPETRLAQGDTPHAPNEALPCTGSEEEAPPRAPKEAPRAPETPIPYTSPEEVPDVVPEEMPGVAPEAVPEAEAPRRPSPETKPRPLPALKADRAAPRLQFTVTSGAYLAQAGSDLTRGYGLSANPGILAQTKAGDGRPLSVAMLRRNQASTTETRHRQSLRLAVGVSYSFTPRWSVASGLSYTVLRSDYNTESGETTTYTTRHLHYLGIPLSLQWKALEWKRLSLYLNAGPMWETALASRLGTRSYVGAAQASEEVESQPVKDSRWSLNAGVGLQYQLFRRGALFLQPGLSWHIPGDGSPESYYTAHPLAPELSFGYRFTF